MYKKTTALFMVMTILFLSLPLRASAAELSVSARAAVLMDAETGAVIYEKNSREIHSMASTTKVMTALLAVEYIAAAGDETVGITKEMVMVEGSSMGLREGDTIALSGLVVGMLLPSGNDAANAAAIHIAGSIEAFAERMNAKANALGMNDSHFVTPSGLDDEQHYTTAYDMALLTAAAIQNEVFLESFSKNRETVTYSGGEKAGTFQNHNKLLRIYESCIGGKTGFTKKSGRCLVAAAEREGCRLVAVTLNAPDDWNDHMNLFELGFSGIQKQHFPAMDYRLPKAEGGAFIVRLRELEKSYISGGEFTRIISLPRFIYAASLKKGDTVGSITYLRDGKTVWKHKIIY